MQSPDEDRAIPGLGLPVRALPAASCCATSGRTRLLDLLPAPALAGLLLVAAVVVATLYIARHWR